MHLWQQLQLRARVNSSVSASHPPRSSFVKVLELCQDACGSWVNSLFHFKSSQILQLTDSAAPLLFLNHSRVAFGHWKKKKKKKKKFPSGRLQQAFLQDYPVAGCIHVTLLKAFQDLLQWNIPRDWCCHRHVSVEGCQDYPAYQHLYSNYIITK